MQEERGRSGEVGAFKEGNVFPAEKVVGAFLLLALVLYRGFGIPLRNPYVFYWEKLSSGLAWYGAGLCIALLIRRLIAISGARKSGSKKPWSDTWNKFSRNYLSLRSLICDLRLVHAISLCFVVFLQLKHLTPFVNSRVHDRLLSDMELELFGGRLLGEILQGLLGVESARVLSGGYLMFFPYMGVLILTLILQRNARLAHEFCAAFALLWLGGVLLIYALPSWGPCFSSPHIFASLPETEVSLLQQKLWLQKEFVELHPESRGGIFLISGFPSLHLAVVILGSLYLARVSPLLGLVSWIFAVVTVITTLYFGWHFVLDDLGSFVLAGAVYAAVRKCFTEDKALAQTLGNRTLA